jgi:tRNA threonylcarbamoyl adenosine modification protein YeaZ
MNHILAFDVSNNNISIAISKDTEIISFCQEHTPSVQAEKLSPMIEGALNKANISYKALNYLAVTNGPGSFTGIRIGLSTARAIGLCMPDLKAFVVTNFELAFYRLKEQVKSFEKAFILIDAYRDQTYLQEFNSKGQSKTALLVNNIELVDYMNASDIVLSSKIVCAGSGVYKNYSSLISVKNIQILPRFPKIRAVNLCYLAQEMISSKSFRPLNPLYIRPPAAKIASKV